MSIYNPSDGIMYRVFTAIINSDLSFTILQNTLGGVPILINVATGEYIITLAGAFPTSRTVAWIGVQSSVDMLCYATVGRNSDDELSVITWIGNSDPELALSNILGNNPNYLEVRVYA